jgi:hypothetical protein
MGAKKAVKKAVKKTAKKATKKAPAKAAKKGAPQKKPESYLTARPGTVFSLEDYTKKPAACFLTQVIEAKNSFDYAKRKFEKNSQLSVEATDNLQQITGPLFAATMGHFETFQKCFFAGLLDVTRLLENWNPEGLEKSVGSNLNVPVTRLVAYRGQGAQIGLLFADSMRSWHSPKDVNGFFKCFGAGSDLFLSEEIGDLEVLWQIRHSLVHTGGWLTLPDAQKIKRLSKYGDGPLAFNDLFMLAFTRLMHKTVKTSVERMDKMLRPRLRSDLDSLEKQEFDDLLSVFSPSPSFF